MYRAIYTCLLLTLTIQFVFCVRRRVGLRVRHGKPDTKDKYKFVIAVMHYDLEFCSGVLISPEWVLTAGHCLKYEEYVLTHIEFNDPVEHTNSSRGKSNILEQIIHPGYRFETSIDDIGLLCVKTVSLLVYAKISAVDYKSMVGVRVEYVGYGLTENENDSDSGVLRVGEGVVKSCFEYDLGHFLEGLYLCVAPKCSNKKGSVAPGDSGGPLFYDGRVVGVLADVANDDGCFTAVSPYITWISEVMSRVDDK